MRQKGDKAPVDRMGGFGIVTLGLALTLAACGPMPASPDRAASAPPSTVTPATTGAASGAPVTGAPPTGASVGTQAPAPPTSAARQTSAPSTTGSGATTADPAAPHQTTGGPTPGPAAASPGTGTSSAGAPPTTVPGPPRLQLGSRGSAVLSLQQRLTNLGYWLGSPDGVFGNTTEQAVFAYQKAAGLTADGVVGPKTSAALASGVVPRPRSTSGYVIEIDLAKDLMLFVDNGKVEHVLNTSTGGGYVYSSDGVTAVANTPVGQFSIFRQVDGMVTDSLGQLWRPKFFYSGFAIHGDGYVPPFPVSHGCARVTDEAIDWIWADNLAPTGTEVWVY